MIQSEPTTFTREEVLIRLFRKKRIAEELLVTATQKAGEGSSYYTVKKKELELEIAFLNALINFSSLK